MGDKETEVTGEDSEIKKRTGDIYKKRQNVKEARSQIKISIRQDSDMTG